MDSTTPNRVDAARRFAVDLADHAQDALVFLLVLALLGLAARALLDLSHLITTATLDVRASIAEVLYVLVIVELIEILIVYLREHRVAVDFMVEVAIVSVLREIVGHGVIDVHWAQLLATAALLLVLGALVRFGEFRAHHGFGTGRNDPGSPLEGPDRPSGSPG
ncbi:MAG TPA: phosphate-starvation-inducible PsiE family protein [Thermomicrobiaceae bacterium]|nr:phosphate-starvation-inducible PsiE family protein [Thermomicrobiaceae bacterium]